MLDEAFTFEILAQALKRHSKRPLKALLLDQRYFPGMGNWMADEVLWRANLHPNCRSPMMGAKEQKKTFSTDSFCGSGCDEISRNKGEIRLLDGYFTKDGKMAEPVQNREWH